MKPVDIVLTTWKRELITKLCIETLEKNTKTCYRLIVVDNGSDDEFSDWLNYHADIYCRLDDNIGLEAAKHLGMSFVSSELFVSTDNDILVPRPTGEVDWLQKLINLHEKYPEFASIALRPPILVGTGDIFGKNPPEVLEFSHVPGYMRLMETKLVNDLGAWSDKRPLRGHEEYWISEKIIAAGRKCGWASYVPCYHMFGDTGKDWGYKDMIADQHGHEQKDTPIDDWKVIRRDFL